MIEKCWEQWQKATDELDMATRGVEGALCEPVAAQRLAWSHYVALRRIWERSRQKCEKSLRNFQVLSCLP